jgi:hypothetical protein
MKPLPSKQTRHDMAEAAVDMLLDGIRVRSPEPETA